MMIVVNESAAASYLYLMGLTIDEELPLTQHLSLLPSLGKLQLSCALLERAKSLQFEFGMPNLQ